MYYLIDDVLLGAMNSASTFVCFTIDFKLFANKQTDDGDLYKLRSSKHLIN